ncbi:molybdopterin-dependent oxidoreductase [bacterium]|nr:molybdopterin-dependent oxidoreductase [bacterium]
MKNQDIVAGHEGHYKEITIRTSDNEPDIWGAQQEYSIVGKKIPRIEAIEKITGKAKYTHDINLPNMLYGVLLTCPHAKATLRNIDTTEAESMPGVVAIETLRIVRRANYAGTIFGVVAAETIQQARDAARKVKVEYEVSSFDVNPHQSPADPVSPVAVRNIDEEDVEGQFAASSFMQGNPELGLRQADVSIEHTYTTPMTPHFCLETHGSAAEWENEQLTVWASTQAIWRCRSDAASAGRVSTSQTRLICQHMGGGFGSKFNLEQYDRLGIDIAKQTGRPVKIMADRWNDATSCGFKPGSRITLQVGAKQDGRLTSMRMDATSFSGQNGSFDPPLRHGYECPNISASTKTRSLNIAPPRAFRGPGRPQGTFALEMALDELAAQLDMNPLDLRLKNVTSHPTDAREYALNKGADIFGWYDKYHKPGSTPGPIKKGVGLAMSTWNYGSSANSATLRCSIHKDGSVEVATGSQDLGTGNRTAMAVVAAESLGIAVERVKVNLGDTNIGLQAPVSWGSISTGAIAPAVRAAVYQAQLQLFEPIAASWNTTVGDLQCKNGVVNSKSDPTKQMAWEEVAGKITNGPITHISSNKHLNAPGIQTGAQMRGAQFAEVEVDTRTGQVRCKKIVAIHECGKTMARAQAESQIGGGVMMGLSYALLEDWIFDPMQGRPLNSNMENYKIMGLMEAPDIEAVVFDVYDPINCACAKGLGEPPHIPTAGAVGCAVYNALGIPIRDLPITPDKIWQALEGGNES